MACLEVSQARKTFRRGISSYFFPQRQTSSCSSGALTRQLYRGGGHGSNYAAHAGSNAELRYHFYLETCLKPNGLRSKWKQCRQYNVQNNIVNKPFLCNIEIKNIIFFLQNPKNGNGRTVLSEIPRFTETLRFSS